jgi:hypothetical protein
MTEPYEYWMPLSGSVIGFMTVWLSSRFAQSPSIRFCAPSHFPPLSQFSAERQTEILTSAFRKFLCTRFGFIPFLLAGLLFPVGYFLYFVLRDRGLVPSAPWIAGVLSGVGACVALTIVSFVQRRLLAPFVDQSLKRSE